MKFGAPKCGEPKPERAWLRYSLPLHFCGGVDNDGDKALVVAEPTLIKVAERECKNVVPLYYPMAKAAPQELTPEAFYNGMVAAWTGGNIGTISNKITKIWAMPDPDVDAVKILCMINNFVIDYAKTLYRPVIPKEWQERLAKIDREKLPAFFKYAKGKADSQIKDRGDNVVDRIYKQMPIYKFRFNLSEVGPFDYRLLMYNDAQKIEPKEQEIVDVFREESAHIGGSKLSGMSSEDNRFWWKFKELRRKMDTYGNRQYVCDVLIKALYDTEPTKRKAALWYCYGDVMYENLADALEYYDGLCLKCGKRFSKKHTNRRYCPDCEPVGESLEMQDAECILCGCTFKTSYTLDSAICPACKMSVSADLRCLDCGAPIEKVKRGRPSVRCASCQRQRNLEKSREWKIKYRPKKR